MSFALLCSRLPVKIWLSLSTLIMQPQFSFAHHPHPHSCHHISVYRKAIIIIIIIIMYNIQFDYSVDVSVLTAWMLFKCFCDSICLPHARLMYVREISPNCLIFPSKLGSSRVIPLGMLSSYGFLGYKLCVFLAKWKS